MTGRHAITRQEGRAVASVTIPRPQPALAPLPGDTQVIPAEPVAVLTLERPPSAVSASPYQVGAKVLAEHGEWAYIPERGPVRPPTAAEVRAYAARASDPAWAYIYRTPDVKTAAAAWPAAPAPEPLPKRIPAPARDASIDAHMDVFNAACDAEETRIVVPAAGPEAGPGTEGKSPAEAAEEPPAPVAEVSQPAFAPRQGDPAED